MTNPKKPTSWWQTLPGVLTALAAVITAISGLVAILFQNGVLGSKSETNRSIQQVSPVANAQTSTDSTLVANTLPRSLVSSKSWNDADAIIFTRDGVITRIRANSLSNCISVNHELALEGGQSIPFERMSSFDVLHSDGNTTPNAKAKVNITLLDGSKLVGIVDATCDLFGYNDVGRFATYYDRIQSVHFER